MKQNIDIDFVQKSILHDINLSGFLTLLVSFLLAFLTWHTFEQHQIKLAIATESLLQTSQKLQKWEVAKPGKVTVSNKQFERLTEDYNLLATPWSKLFDTIEKSEMPDIALLSISPNLKKRQILLTGEAKNLATVLLYVSKLAKQTTLSQVYLQKHNVIESINERPVGFTVIAKWNNAKYVCSAMINCKVMENN